MSQNKKEVSRQTNIEVHVKILLLNNVTMSQLYSNNLFSIFHDNRAIMLPYIFLFIRESIR